MIGGGTWEGAYARRETPRVHHAARRRSGGRVAAHGAGATADDRILAQFVARWCRTLVAAFRQGLNITGFVEVRTLVEYRNIAAPAAKAATRSIPIVFAGGAQPPGRRAASANARIAAALSCED
jgi:hypothetical protein